MVNPQIFSPVRKTQQEVAETPTFPQGKGCKRKGLKWLCNLELKNPCQTEKGLESERPGTGQ
jgi:hypothetical protein